MMRRPRPSHRNSASTPAILAAGVCAALLCAGPALPALAQKADGRLAVRPDSTAGEPQALQSDIRARIDVETARMRDHVETLRDGQNALDRCTAEAAAPDGDDMVPTIMDCFADQAMLNQQVLLDWSASLEALETIFADGALHYGELADAKASQIDDLLAARDALEDERAELRRRLARVRSFLEANGTRLEGKAQHEAMRLRLEWAQIDHRAAHNRALVDRMRTARQAYLDAESRLEATARDADLLALDFTYRAEREAFYVAEVSEATLTEIVLEQVAGMNAGMGQITQNMDAARVALDAAADDRPVATVAPLPDARGSFLGEMEAAEDLEDWILTLDMEARQ